MTERLPENRLIFSDVTKDGMLTITVWLDGAPPTDLMRDSGIGGMGTLTIYNNHSLQLAHEERVPLSCSTVEGPGPAEEDMNYWTKLINQFYTDFE